MVDTASSISTALRRRPAPREIQAEEDHMPDPTERLIRPVMHHVNLKTRRLQEMIDWYATTVGTRVNFRFPGGAFISNDRANHRIALLTLPGLQEDPQRLTRTGLHHTAFEYGSFDDLMSSYARLKTNGIEPDACLNHGPTTSLYYSDPDHNMVELQVDNFADWEASSEWMRTSEDFRRDPIGAFFDPDLVLAAYRAGATFKQLQQDTRAGKYPPDKPPKLNLPPLPG
jgi:catechol 2,3-dioxygenase